MEKENDAGGVEHIPILKTFTVFNVQQIDCLALTSETVSTEATFVLLPLAENLFRKSGTNIIEKRQNAFSAHQLMKNAGLLAVDTVLEIPVTGNAWLDKKIQNVGIGDFKEFIRRFDSTDFRYGKGHMGGSN